MHLAAQSIVVGRKQVDAGERGAVARLRASHVTRAASTVRLGRVYDLGLERYRGMPLPPMHPPFEVVGYRSPAGLRAQRDQDWIIDAEHNATAMAFNSELVMMCLHTGTHLDSLAHITVGEEARWFGGFEASRHLGDFGPMRADASTIPPIVTRGVLLDVAGARGMSALPAHDAIGARELAEVAETQGTPIEDGDVVLVRTGYLSAWPDRERLADHAGAGIDVSAARWLVERGAVVVGADTEAVECLPSLDPTSPHPVHSYLLVERGVLLVELVDLEQLARDRIYAFMFIGAPLKIRGGTAGILDPIALV